MAIYIRDNTSDDYELYRKSANWPLDDYSYEKAKCYYRDGSELNETEVNKIISVSNNQIILDSNTAVFCDMYFIKKEAKLPTAIETLRDKDTKDQLTDDLACGLYRYQGTTSVNNYICFGTTDKSKCISGSDVFGNGIDKYMYRIIGVTKDGELALIKETGVKKSSIVNKFKWNNISTTTECGDDGSGCTWPNSQLYKGLNGLLNSDSNIFIGNSYYEYLNNNSEWLNKINAHTWKYGDTDNYGWYDGNKMCPIESEFTLNIQSKVGLQYLHDYYYAYPNGNPGDDSKAKTSWIHLRKDGYNLGFTHEWLITRLDLRNTYFEAWLLSSDSDQVGHIINENGVRPVFYLKADTKIKSGTGSKTDPFIIDGI